MSKYLSTLSFKDQTEQWKIIEHMSSIELQGHLQLLNEQYKLEFSDLPTRTKLQSVRACVWKQSQFRPRKPRKYRPMKIKLPSILECDSHQTEVGKYKSTLDKKPAMSAPKNKIKSSNTDTLSLKSTNSFMSIHSIRFESIKRILSRRRKCGNPNFPETGKLATEYTETPGSFQNACEKFSQLHGAVKVFKKPATDDCCETSEPSVSSTNGSVEESENPFTSPANVIHDDDENCDNRDLQNDSKSDFEDRLEDDPESTLEDNSEDSPEDDRSSSEDSITDNDCTITESEIYFVVDLSKDDDFFDFGHAVPTVFTFCEDEAPQMVTASQASTKQNDFAERVNTLPYNLEFKADIKSKRLRDVYNPWNRHPNNLYELHAGRPGCALHLKVKNAFKKIVGMKRK